jgi:serine/threonine protein phosphatase PrpC
VNWEDIIVDAAATDTGMRRAINQDSRTVVRASNPEVWQRRGHVFMVADGMGAHAVGELASKLACDNIPHHYLKSKTGTPAEAITKAYREVGSLIHAKAAANQDFQGMGTTCSTLVLLPAGALIAHVGDSRVYRIRNGRIDQLSFDHSLVWELIRRNHLPNDQALKSVPKNVITRSLGPDPQVEVDIEGPLPVEKGDVYLLCSDGLSGPVVDPELGVFAANFHPEDACRYLIYLANLRGGQDNITAVILRIGPWIDPQTAPDEAAAEAAADRKPRRGLSLAGLLGTLNRRAAPAPVEEHLYRSADCPIDDALLDRLNEQLRSGQATAVTQAWSLDWSELAKYRRLADEARAAGDPRTALRNLGEAIVLLGLAGRIHRKEQGQNVPRR